MSEPNITRLQGIRTPARRPAAKKVSPPVVVPSTALDRHALFRELQHARLAHETASTLGADLALRTYFAAEVRRLETTLLSGAHALVKLHAILAKHDLIGAGSDGLQKFLREQHDELMAAAVQPAQDASASRAAIFNWRVGFLRQYLGDAGADDFIKDSADHYCDIVFAIGHLEKVSIEADRQMARLPLTDSVATVRPALAIPKRAPMQINISLPAPSVVVQQATKPAQQERPWPTRTIIRERDAQGRADVIETRPLDE